MTTGPVKWLWGFSGFAHGCPSSFHRTGTVCPRNRARCSRCTDVRAHGPVGPVEFDLRAVVHSVRALAAQFIQTPAVAGLFGIEGGSEFAVVEVSRRSHWSHAVAVEHRGGGSCASLMLSPRRKATSVPTRFSGFGAAADVDGLDALRAEAFVDAHRAGGLGACSAERAPGARRPRPWPWGGCGRRCRVWYARRCSRICLHSPWDGPSTTQMKPSGAEWPAPEPLLAACLAAAMMVSW